MRADEPGSLRLALLEQVPTAVLILAFVLASFVLRAAWGLGNPLDGLGGGRGYALVPVLGAHGLAFGYLARSKRSDRGSVLTFGRLAALLLVSVLVPLCLGVFASWKWTIPRLHPFTWDARLDALDRSVHGGTLPWQLLQPWLGFPTATVVLDRLYALWIPLSAIVLVWQAFRSRAFARAHFFLTYVTVYVFLGTVLAIAFSSGGPCYYTQLTGDPGPYQPLMSYLHSLNATTPLFAVEGQAVLWRFYLEGRGVPFLSISAMPSVHVAVAVLFALAGWEANRVTGLLLTAYALVVLVASVHLGWHYAVDGYFAALATAVIWIATGAALQVWFKAIHHPDSYTQ